MQHARHNMPNPTESRHTQIPTPADPHLATAMEQASAPGLSLATRCEKLLGSIIAPDLFKFQSEIPVVVSERNQKILTLAAFQKTSEYRTFKEILDNTFRELDTIANECEPSPSVPQPFQTLGSRLWQPAKVIDPSHYGVFQTDLVQQACPNAQRLLRLHEFAKQHPDLVATNSQLSVVAGVKSLAGSVDVCGPGVVQNFEEAVNSARQAVFTPSLSERVQALRLQLIRSTIADDMRSFSQDQTNLPNFEIHLVAAWQNHFSEQFGLPVIDDVYASRQYTLNPAEQNRLSRKLHAVHTRPAVARVLATEILQDANALWHSAQAKGATDFGQHCMALLNTLQNMHGELSAHALIRMDEDSLPLGFHHNPTLLALHIVKQLESEPNVSPWEPGLNQVWNCTDPKSGRSLNIMQCGPLLWAEISHGPGSGGSTEKHLLSAHILKPVELESFMKSIDMNAWRIDLRKAALLEMLITDWGKEQPQIQAIAFNPRKANEVFVHLALGLAQGRDFGVAEMKDRVFQLAMRGFMQSYKYSNVPELYTPQHFTTLLEYTRAWNLDTGKPSLIDFKPFLVDTVQLRSSVTAMSAFKAVIEFHIKYNWSSFIRLNIKDFKALICSDIQFGLALLETIKTKGLKELNLLLYNHISQMKSPDLILAFVDAGADPNQDVDHGHTALQRLLDNTNDELIEKTLTQLRERKVPIDQICRREYVNELIAQNRPMSAGILQSLIKN